MNEIKVILYKMSSFCYFITFSYKAGIDSDFRYSCISSPVSSSPSISRLSLALTDKDLLEVESLPLG